MGIIFNRKPCTNCGSTTLHRECFSGGSKTQIFYTDRDLKTAARQVAFNESQGKKGKDRFKGVDRELASALKFDTDGAMKSHLREARRKQGRG